MRDKLKKLVTDLQNAINNTKGEIKQRKIDDFFEQIFKLDFPKGTIRRDVTIEGIRKRQLVYSENIDIVIVLIETGATERIDTIIDFDG